MNALTKNIIRIWIAITSMFAFAIGWISLSHSPKPVAAAQQTTQTTDTTSTTVSGIEFAPVVTLQDLTNGKPSSSLPSFSITTTTPRLRTRGS